MNSRQIIGLNGSWSATLEDWNEPGKTISREITLPGTLDEHGLGPVPSASSEHLTRKHAYEGRARYERRVMIPEEWRDKVLFFGMERTRGTELWIDGIQAGSCNTLSTPQLYNVTGYLDPGQHVLSVVVDNASGIMSWKSIRNSHMATDHTQTNWNGILGDIELTAVEPLRIGQIRLYPQRGGEVRGKAVISKPADGTAEGRLSLSILDSAGSKLYVGGEIPFRLEAGSCDREIPFIIPASDALEYWDEFNPVQYTVHAVLEGTYREQATADELTVPLGIRTFGVAGTQFEVNGRTTFLRGKHDACVFPLTGYAPMEKESWLEVFRTAKAYGINHYRFHSWCPPRAAFEAADQSGMYLQPELPFWDPGTAFQNDEEWQYFSEETFRIIEAYGNHPSFVMFAWGNELAGSMERMEALVEKARSWDPGKLYAIGSNNFFLHAGLPGNSDYWTTFWTEGSWNVKKAGYGGKHVRGATPHPTRGFINNSPPSGRKDYREEIRGVSLPVIGHEVGQYQVYPDFREIDKYQGVLKPEHLIRFRSLSVSSGLLEQADNLHAASGRLAALCYREEIEAALRTPGMAGFQLLDLQDFPGQGGAFVGMLDAFMEPKGIITPEEWRRFCSEVVPLARLHRYVWTEGESILWQAEIANYGPEPLTDAAVIWSITGADGGQIGEGRLTADAIPQGGLWSAGECEFRIPAISKAEKWTLQLSIEGTAYNNEYSLWIYPDLLDISIPASVVVADAFDENTRRELRSGRTVLLIPPAQGSFGSGPEGTFIPDFWCFPMFKKYGPPGTLGLYCDRDHPALEAFPTAAHAQWQWWHLMRHYRAIVLDDSAADYRPIVQVIDNVARQHKLGIVFEAKVSGGKLLVCSIDLWSQMDRPEARQLLHSLLNYCSSDRFTPGAEWTEDFTESLFAAKEMSVVAGNPNADNYG
ncbi:glycoside hydrolase family 2 TIM barrel-domain containing protein [Paenibacillus sp. FSL L8-0470]